MDKNIVLISGAVLFKEYRRKRKWFLVKHDSEGDWEIPKVVVRKVESSVRAALRMMGEQGGISGKVLEEAGRAGGSATVNGKVLPQRYIYYLMMLRDSGGESIGFPASNWFKYADAIRKLSSKREKQMLRQAREELKKWQKERERRKKL